MTPENSSSPLPDSVVARLKTQKGRLEQGAFTSSFGVGEFLLAKHGGYESLGQVMGASVYQIGIQWSNPNWSDEAKRRAKTEGTSMEFNIMTTAYANTRDLALSRLEAEAAALGAEGVVGVELRIEATSDEEAAAGKPRVIEFVAIGTAVRSAGFGKGTPFLSNLSGAELWALKTADYEPCGLVFGNCSYVQSLSWETQNKLTFSIKQNIINFEVEEYTRGFYTARELAIGRLYDQARAYHAHGVVGVTVELIDAKQEIAGVAGGVSTNALLSAITFSFHATGTAIRACTSRTPKPTSGLHSLPFPVISLKN